MNFRQVVSCFVLALPIVAMGQDAPRKISKVTGMNAVQEKVAPEYPPFAKQLKIEGTVELEAVVAENGTVEDVKIVSGNAMLTKAGADALKKWKYKPFMEADGKPFKALVPVSFDFKR
jgi:protein TonB